MIANAERTVVLSSLGWVEHDALWTFDVASGTEQTTPLRSGARHASLHHSGTDHFAVAHHSDGARFEVTVRRFSSPHEVAARATVDDAGARLSGDASLWKLVPRLHVEYLAFSPWRDHVLIRISPAAEKVEIQRLAWYGDEYDKMYQSVVGVLELPDEEALVSVQRSSRLVVHDLVSGGAKRFVDLAGHAGNPGLQLRDAGEVWASDYDTLVALRTADWRIRHTARFHSWTSGTQQFIGQFSFSSDRKLCLVARPFGGEAVAVDTTSLRVRGRARLGGQPLEVVALAGGDIVARDWKTGALLRGRL